MTNTTAAGATTTPAAGRRRKAAAPAPTGPDRIPKPSQGWYRDKVTGAKLRRVTTILEQGAPRQALVFWAGNITAETALANLPYLVSSSLYPDQRTEAYDWLRRAHTRKKDARANVGSAVHELIEAHVLGQPVSEALLNDEELAPYLEHFQSFISDWEVEFEASEMVVGNFTHEYAGTLDYLLRSRLIATAIGAPADAVICGDTKTGGELDVKGVYATAGLQMAAYANSEVAWLRDGTKVPLPAMHTTGVVLHLRPEGYRLIPLRCDEAVFNAFLDVKRVSEFERDLSKTVVGDALALPALTEGAAA